VAHKHKWIFVSYSWRLRGGNNGQSATPMNTENYSIWICECGVGKEVIHKFKNRS